MGAALKRHKQPAARVHTKDPKGRPLVLEFSSLYDAIEFLKSEEQEKKTHHIGAGFGASLNRDIRKAKEKTGLSMSHIIRAGVRAVLKRAKAKR